MNLERSASPLVRVSTWALRSYLCVLLTGCGAHRPALITLGTPAKQSAPAKEPKPAKQPKQPKLAKQHQPPVEETHLFLGDERAAFQSCVAALEDAGYEIDETDVEQGVIRGSLSTRQPLGVIVSEREPLDQPMPGWQVGALVLTAAAVVTAGVLSLKGAESQDGALIDDRVDAALAMIGMASTIKLPPPIDYEYQIAIQLLPMEANTTQVRVVLDGTERQKDEPERTGAVQAPEFLARFYAALDQATHAEPDELRQHALSVR